MVKTEKVEMSERQATKKKLMAATSMLLVACIMLVSASYAWFTLSTHPEITGIATNVGANGSLEIALASNDTWNNGTPVETSTASGEEVTVSNLTWGNLVSLDSDTYGLAGIKLMPARLSVSSGYVNLVNPLQVAEYGNDGRITGLGNAFYASYSNSKYAVGNGAGVRAIGTADAMTEREAVYRTSKGEFTTQTAAAVAIAQKALTDHGTTLAGIAVDYALNNKAEGYTTEQFNAIKAVIAELKTVSASLDAAWEEAVLAYVASAKVEDQSTGIDGLKDEEGFLEFKEQFESTTENDGTVTKGYTYEKGNDGVGRVTLTTKSNTQISVELPAALTGFKTTSDAIADNINTAYTSITSATEAQSYSWTEIYGYLSPLINTDGVKVNGYTVEQAKSDKNAVVNKVISDGGVEVQLAAGSGAFYDLAALCGNYQVNIDVSVAGLIDNIPATMKTVAESKKADEVTQAINNAGSPVGSGAASSYLTDTYGYQLDFFLRTNATGSSLLLQQNGAQRIYSDSNNEETMGEGSTMTFTGSVGFDTNKMKSLMEAIRVVFMDGSGKILGIAVLDLSKPTINADNYTVKANLKLVDYTFNSAGVLSITGDKSDQKLMETMTANTAVKVSTLVYLDGDQVDNADVANALTSMTGTMNLQFASNANLVPMQNTSLLGDVKVEDSSQIPKEQN